MNLFRNILRDNKSNLLSENKRKENKHMNETLNVNLNNLTEEERNTLLALVEKSVKEPKVWKPEINEKYYYVRSDGGIDYSIWNNDKCDNNSYTIGNCFKDKEDAEFVREKLKVIADLKRFAQEHNTLEINWNDIDQEKYYFYYNCTYKRFDINLVYGTKGNAIYFSSKEIAEQAVKEIGEERIEKYYFEVE